MAPATSGTVSSGAEAAAGSVARSGHVNAKDLPSVKRVPHVPQGTPEPPKNLHFPGTYDRFGQLEALDPEEENASEEGLQSSEEDGGDEVFEEGGLNRAAEPPEGSEDALAAGQQEDPQ